MATKRREEDVCVWASKAFKHLRCASKPRLATNARHNSACEGHRALPLHTQTEEEEMNPDIAKLWIARLRDPREKHVADL